MTPQDIDSARLTGFLEDMPGSLSEILLRLNEGDNNYALMLTDEMKSSLALLPDPCRGEGVRNVGLWIQNYANGRMAQMHDILGIQRELPAVAEDNDIRESVILQCLQEAATTTDKYRHDELIVSAVKHLAYADTLVIRRWKTEMARLVGVDGKTFDALIKDARQSKSAPDAAQDYRAKGPTDDELADEWKAAHPHTAFDGGEFRRYQDGTWPTMPEHKVNAEIKAVMVATKPRGVRPTSRLLSSVKKLAEGDIFIASHRWDADPDLLVCRNGTLHIPTLKLQTHSPNDYQTSGLDFDYNSNTPAPVWKYFLDSTVTDAAAFLQEFAGYALTTDTKHETAIWLFGPAGSGKSTFLAGLQAMLGTRAGLLGLADVEKSRFALADLPGKTLVVATEQPSSYMTATHVLNSIISGEPITADRKFRDAVKIIPRAKLAWAMNELPRVPDAGNGLFRRVKVVKFPPLADTPDPKVKEQIKQEGAGILNWALAGLARLRWRGRFEVPPCVETATAQFRSANDVPSLFVAECCLMGADHKVQSKLLYDEYKVWCEGNGHRPQSATSLAAEWERLGFERYRPGGITFYKGVGLPEKVPLV